MMSSDDNNSMMSTPSMPYQSDSLERLQKVANTTSSLVFCLIKIMNINLKYIGFAIVEIMHDIGRQEPVIVLYMYVQCKCIHYLKSD